jgi:hypothetical protein
MVGYQTGSAPETGMSEMSNRGTVLLVAQTLPFGAIAG